MRMSNNGLEFVLGVLILAVFALACHVHAHRKERRGDVER